MLLTRWCCCCCYCCCCANQYLRDEGVPSRVMDMADAGYANTMGGTLQQLGLSQTANMESQFASDGDNDARLEPSSRVVRKCRAQQHDSCQPMTSRLLPPRLVAAARGASQGPRHSLELACAPHRGPQWTGTPDVWKWRHAACTTCRGDSISCGTTIRLVLSGF